MKIKFKFDVVNRCYKVSEMVYEENGVLFKDGDESMLLNRIIILLKDLENRILDMINVYICFLIF